MRVLLALLAVAAAGAALVWIAGTSPAPEPEALAAESRSALGGAGGLTEPAALGHGRERGRTDTDGRSGSAVASAPEPQDRTQTGEREWVVLGTVTDPSGYLLSDVQVDLWAASESPRHLGGARTGVDGRFRAKAEGEFGLLHVRFRADRFLPDFREVVLDGATGRIVPVDVVLQPGGTVRGRVLDAKGHPVPQAMVALHREGENAEDAFTVQTDLFDVYEIVIREVGSQRVLAWREGVGAARSHEHFLGPDSYLAMDDLTLRGKGALERFARLERGGSARGLRVLAVAEGLSYAEAAPERDPAAVADGLLRGVGAVNRFDRFELGGLREGRYRLMSWELWKRDPDLAMERSAIATTGKLGTLTLPGYRLLISLVDSRGNWPPDWRVQVFEGSEPDPSFDRSGERAVSQSARTAAWSGVLPGFLVHWTLEPATLRIRAEAEGFEAAEERVVLNERRGDNPVTLLLESTVERGDLRVAVNCRGDRVRGGLAQLRLLTGGAVTGFEGYRALLPDGWLRGVPAGTYRLELHPGIAHAHRIARNHYEPVILDEITIPVRGETKLFLDTRELARLDVELAAALEGADPARRWTAALHRTDEPEQELRFRVEALSGERAWLAAASVNHAVELLEPGDAVLRVGREDGEPLEIACELRPGETTRVRVEPPAADPD